jgi:hypothetical protein
VSREFDVVAACVLHAALMVGEPWQVDGEAIPALVDHLAQRSPS